MCQNDTLCTRAVPRRYHPEKACAQSRPVPCRTDPTRAKKHNLLLPYVDRADPVNQGYICPERSKPLNGI